MRKADFKARIKKIEIVNRSLSDGWSQSIRVILEDIDLTNENLLELKQFMPNENVLVEIAPIQPSFFDLQSKNQAPSLIHNDQFNEEDELSISFAEEEDAEDTETLLRKWDFI